jgi:chromosome segregation ATPase
MAAETKISKKDTTEQQKKEHLRPSTSPRVPPTLVVSSENTAPHHSTSSSSAIEARISSLEAAVQREKDAKEAALADAASKDKEIVALRQNIQNLESQRTVKDNEIATLRQSNQALESQRAVKDNEIATLRQSNQALRRQIIQAPPRQRTDRDNDIATLRHNYQTLKHQCMEMQQRLQQNDRTMAALQVTSTFKQAIEAKRALQERFDKLTEKFNDLQQEHASLSRKWLDKHSADIKRHVKTDAEPGRYLSIEERRHAIKEKIEKLRTEIKMLEGDLQHLADSP